MAEGKRERFEVREWNDSEFFDEAGRDKRSAGIFAFSNQYPELLKAYEYDLQTVPGGVYTVTRAH